MGILRIANKAIQLGDGPLHESILTPRHMINIDQPLHCLALQLRDPEHLRIGHRRQQDLRRRLFLHELLHELDDAAVEEVG